MNLNIHISTKFIVAMHESLQIYQSLKDHNIKLQSKLVTELQTLSIAKASVEIQKQKIENLLQTTFFAGKVPSWWLAPLQGWGLGRPPCHGKDW